MYYLWDRKEKKPSTRWDSNPQPLCHEVCATTTAPSIVPDRKKSNVTFGPESGLPSFVLCHSSRWWMKTETLQLTRLSSISDEWPRLKILVTGSRTIERQESADFDLGDQKQKIVVKLFSVSKVTNNDTCYEPTATFWYQHLSKSIGFHQRKKYLKNEI